MFNNLWQLLAPHKCLSHKNGSTNQKGIIPLGIFQMGANFDLIPK